MKRTLLALSAAAMATAGTLCLPTAAFAAPVLCQTTTNNHMYVDSAYVSVCVDAGLGNIGQGNQNNDDFLKDLPLVDGLRGGYTTIGDQSFTQTGLTGTFSINAALWDTWSQLFIGFKFGTGNEPDEWFVYQLADNVSSGDWEFVNVFGKGGGLSHVTVYGKGAVDGSEDGGGVDGGQDGGGAPEPTTLALFGAALALVGARLRRKQ